MVTMFNRVGWSSVFRIPDPCWHSVWWHRRQEGRMYGNKAESGNQPQKKTIGFVFILWDVGALEGIVPKATPWVFEVNEQD